MERLKLLISDVDGTLLGDEAGLEQFRAWRQGPGQDVRLAYNSGRFVESVRTSILVHRLPEPDAIIGGVGTEIFDAAAGRLLPQWPELDGGWEAAEIRRVCRRFPELAPQPSRFISDFKISYFGFDMEPPRLAQLADRLARAGQSVRLVYSSRRDLDILPAGVDKGSAALRLCAAWAIDPRETAVAGDSGNDRAMFCEEFYGIVVGNALAELKALAGPQVYHARSSHAAGVVEGLHHWHALASESRQVAAPLEPVA